MKSQLNCYKMVLLIITTIFTFPAFSSVPFETQPISNEANLWWARALGDINGDGLTDVALQNNNGHGGWLGWLEAPQNGEEWKQHIIAKEAPGGGTFACGDLEIGDIDLDGDLDIIGFKHEGEWDNGGAPTDIFWFENPSWKAHPIGQAPDFVKDVNLVDFNNDKKLDLVTITYTENKMSIFRQDTPAEWTKVHEFTIKNLHEGMDVGDIDGDGDIDIAANGYWVENPGGDLEKEWTIRSIAAQWHNQDGDWSKNACKGFCLDINGDGRDEVFFSHSERSGYPVAWYECDDPKNGKWVEHIIIKNMPACHTLQVFDADNDGDFDVLAGLNKNRAKGIGQTTFPVFLFLNDGNNQSWTKQRLSDDGIYNGQTADLEGDGDIDIFRLPTHDATLFEVWVNQIK